MVRDKAILLNIIHQLGPTVYLPNNDNITSTAHGHLPLPELSSASTKTHILPDLQNSSLLSLGQLCDDNCIIHLTKQYLHVFKNNKLILTGFRNKNDGLWDVPLPQSPALSSSLSNPSPSSPPPTQSLNVIVKKSTTNRDLAQYLHACAFSPCLRTFITAIRKGHFITWPGLTSSLLSKHLPPCVFTAKGHMNQEMQHLQSTSKTYKDALINNTKSTTLSSTESSPLDLDFHPPQDINTPKTHNCFLTLCNPSQNKQTGYLDLTGRFPYRSSRGNQYILTVYDYDSNAILVKAIKNRQAESITSAWKTIVAKLERQGIQPTLFIMDNEASADLKSAMTAANYIFQLVPPENHRKNAAERAIQTFKNHFLAGIASLPQDFPLSEWDHLLEQSEITLLLLRSSRTNPKLSSYAYLNGNFDFNKTPLAPPGTKLVIHNRPNSRPSWGFHAEDGFYIGPALQHYRCVKCYIPKTRSIRISDSVQFFPTIVPIPFTTIDDYLRTAASDIITILNNPPKTAFPTLTLGDSTKQAITKIAELLKRAAPMPSKPPSVVPIKTVTWKTPLTSTSFIPLLGTKSCKSKSSKSSFPSTSPRVHESDATPLATSPRVFPQPDLSPLRRSERLRNKLGKPKSQVPTFSIPTPKSTTSKKHYLPSTFPPRKPFSKPRRSLRKPFRSQAATYLLAQHLFQQQQQPTHAGFIYNHDGTKASLDNLLNGDDSIVWDRALSNEMGRLAQGNNAGIQGTDTIDFIPFSDVPTKTKVTYANFVCTYRPKKNEPWRIRIVAGGDKLSCSYDTGSPAASLLETKLLLNSVISDAHKGARFLTCDLKDFFLASPMEEKEYMRIHIKHFPQDIRDQYNINNIVHTNNFVYIRINKGMYGLKQAAVLAYQNLVHVMKAHGYQPCPLSTGVWTHVSRPTKFCVCVDDFAIKYQNQDDADHLLRALKQHYNITTDWTGEEYCGLSIKWNYKHQYVDVSMPGYIDKVLLHHEKTPLKPTFTPHSYNTPVYGKATQYAPPPDDTPPLPPDRKTRIQAVVGSLLYYARAIDGSLLPALNEISASQANPTVSTEQKLDHLLAFAKTHRNTSLRFHASDMCLHIDSDAAYLVMPNARSRFAGYYHLSSYPPSSLSDTTEIPLNAPILIECKTIRHVVASAAEAETSGLFHNAQTGLILRQLLYDLGHPQPATPLKTDNSTANSFVHSNIRQKRSKSWDMRYHWLRDKKLHDAIRIYWQRGSKNHGDYFTKHHPPRHHSLMRSKYLHICSFLSHHVNLLRKIQHDVSRVATHVQGCISVLPYRGRTDHIRGTQHPPLGNHSYSNPTLGNLSYCDHKTLGHNTHSHMSS